jgi:ribosomal-protein-alanine N-acetyltransferase
MEIMNHVEAISLREGVRRIILEVGRRNIAGRNLYRKCGFSAIGFRKRYYAEIDDDAVVMEKWLAGDSQITAETGSELP